MCVRGALLCRIDAARSRRPLAWSARLSRCCSRAIPPGASSCTTAPGRAACSSSCGNSSRAPPQQALVPAREASARSTGLSKTASPAHTARVSTTEAQTFWCYKRGLLVLKLSSAPGSYIPTRGPGHSPSPSPSPSPGTRASAGSVRTKARTTAEPVPASTTTAFPTITVPSADTERAWPR